MHQPVESNSELICTVCSCEFDIELEGGVDGYLGVLAVSFCPMCFSGLDLFFAEIHGCQEDER